MVRFILAGSAFVILAGTALAQNLRLDDPPVLLKPKTPTRREMDLRESLYKFVDGLQYEHEQKFVEALKEFEDAAKLDPEAPALIKAQVPILIAMNRYDDALAACKKVVALDRNDYTMWYAQAKIHKASVQYAQAIDALQNALKADNVDDHPEAAQALYFELGELYETTDKFGPAADAFNKAAAILEHPDRIEAEANVPREAIVLRASQTYEKIGLLYRKAKQHEQSIAALKKAAERSPNRSAPLHYVMAQISLEAGNSEQALGQLDVYLRTQPFGIEPYELRVDLLRRTKQTGAIVPWLEDCARRDKFNTAVQCLLAKEYAAAKDTKKAEALYGKLIDDSPSAELYRGLFNVHKTEGQAGMTRVLAMLDQVMEEPDGQPSIRNAQRAKAMLAALGEDAELGRLLVDAGFRTKSALQPGTVLFLAILADKHHKNAEAEVFYRKSMTDAKTLKANETALYAGLLRVLAKTRKYEAVIELCEQGLKNAKDTPPLLFCNEIARALAGLYRYDEALKYTDLALKQPGNSELMFKALRVRILTMAERYTDAESECKAMLKDNTRTAEVVEIRYLLSNVYASAKKHAASEEQLQLVLKIDPDNATVANDLGYLWADQGKNLEKAEELIRKALEQDRVQRRKNPALSTEDDKDNAAYVDSLGWVLFRRGKIDEARKELERATTLNDSDDPVIYDHLGDVYQRLNMRPEATRAWQRSLELYKQGIRGKEDERVREVRRKIEQAGR